MVRAALVPLLVVSGVISLLGMHGIAAHGPSAPAFAGLAAVAEAPPAGPTSDPHAHGSPSRHGGDGEHDGEHRRSHPAGLAELCAWIVLGAVVTVTRRSASGSVLVDPRPRPARVHWSPEPPVPRLRLVSTCT